MRFVRAGICLLVAVLVLSFGGVEPWGNFLLEFGAAGLLLVWGGLAWHEKQFELHWNWLYLPLLALVAVGAAQILSGMSAYAFATKLELLRVGAYLIVCFVAVEAYRTESERRSFAWFLAGLGFFVSLFGIVQHSTFNGKLYWLREIPQNAWPFGPFVNSDHFAGFVELAVPPGLAIVLSETARREKGFLLGLLCVLPVGALFLTTSRAGIAGFLIQMAVLALLWRPPERARRRLLAPSALAVSAGALVLLLGITPFLERLETVTPARLSQDRRISLVRDTARMFRHHLWAGTGLGTFEAAFPRYESFYDGKIVQHAHNDYLELLAETGLAGGICGGAFLFLLIREALARLRSASSETRRASYAGAFVSCTGLLVHSLADFNLHIPSNALLFFLLAFFATSEIDEPQVAHVR